MMVNFKVGKEISDVIKHRTKKKYKSPTGIEPMTISTPVGCSIH